jgi:hypothetical protein
MEDLEHDAVGQDVVGMAPRSMAKVDALAASESDAPASEGPILKNLAGLIYLEQYASLRQEVEKRLELRQQLLALTLIIAGTFLSLGVSSIMPNIVVLFYPLIAMFLAAMWEHNDLRIGQINFYIRTELEPHLGTLGPGWETFRRDKYVRRSSGAGNGKVHPLAPARGLIAIGTRGMFLTTQLLALGIGVVQILLVITQPGYSFNLSSPTTVLGVLVVAVLVCADIAALIGTWYFVQHKRT